MTDRELMQMALDALEYPGPSWPDARQKIAEALRARLAQPEQAPTNNGRYLTGYKAQPEPEPVAWGFQNTGITGSNRWMYLRETIPAEDQYRGVLWTPLYTVPPQREWQGLTDEEIENCFEMSMFGTCRAIEAKLKEKNG